LDECDGSIPMHSVDYLFLIEQPCVASTHATETLLSSIETLVQRTQNTTIYRDVKVQYGFILYVTRPHKKIEYVYARDFSHDFPPELRSHLSSEPALACSLSSPAVTSYGGVRSALSVVRRSLKLIGQRSRFHLRITLASNKSVHIWHRPYSDLHILTIMDLDDASGVSDGSGERELEDLQNESDREISKLSEKLTSVPAYPLTLHVFFNASNAAATSLLGTPEAAVRYSDCSHFRKAPTLKALLTKEQGSSLQALLLSKGVEFQLHFLRDLEHSSCILNISPFLSSPVGILPGFREKCPGSLDSDDVYCSALHGWMRKDTRSLNSDLFRDRTPLTEGYKSSHADIAMSASNHTSTGAVSVGELSIIKSSFCSGSKPVLLGQPRSVTWEPNAPFIGDMLEGGQPVVLRGTVVKTWPALKKWNMAYLAKNMGVKVLELVKCTNDFVTFDPDHRAPLKVDIPLSYTLANISTSDFFECVQSPIPCFDGYKGHYYFGPVPSQLKRDISPNTLLFNTERDHKAGKQFVWVSSAGMITHTHFDQDHNIYVQLVGRKRFTLWPPEQHELLYMFPRVHPMWHKSRVNYQDVDTAAFPAFPRARGVQVELGPGDMLYMPPYTWHYVETLSPSVSLSTWSHDYELYDHMNAIYRHDHKFDLLQSQRGEWKGGRGDMEGGGGGRGWEGGGEMEGGGGGRGWEGRWEGGWTGDMGGMGEVGGREEMEGGDGGRGWEGGERERRDGREGKGRGEMGGRGWAQISQPACIAISIVICGLCWSREVWE
jgi:hypothetical protein